MAEQTPADRHPMLTHPTPEMVKWFRLAVAYQHARLGNDMTAQTAEALSDVETFLNQPAQAWGSMRPKVDADTRAEAEALIEERNSRLAVSAWELRAHELLSRLLGEER